MPSDAPHTLFLVNAVEEATAEQSTVSLIAAMAARGPTWVTTPRGLRHVPGELRAAAVRVREQDPEAIPAELTGPHEDRGIGSFDAMWVRLNPGRMVPAGMVGVLETLQQAEDAGLVVRNSAAGLLRATSKLYLSSLPADTVAQTWSSRDPDHLQACIEAMGEMAVVKPAIGTRGAGVHKVSADTEGLHELLAELAARGPVLVQEYLPDAPRGDVRVHVVDGALLEIDGVPAIVRRRPADGEWRSNVSLGGSPTPEAPTEALRDLVARVGPVLVRHGLWHVGLDVVGDRIVECNVFSPGGLGDARQFYGKAFEHELVEQFVQSLAAGSSDS